MARDLPLIRKGAHHVRSLAVTDVRGWGEEADQFEPRGLYYGPTLSKNPGHY